MPRPTRQLVRRIVLFALVFSAISPALAALRFYGNAEVLANIASVYTAAHNSAEHQHSGHANSKVHQVYCSFCLDMASVQALTLAAPHLPLSAMAAEPPPRAVPHSAERVRCYSPQHSRAPPIPSV
ncbi:MAG TPA: DUF2946 family protein [Burkholderiales bacterium]|nr:DUF2946 family protein [Burkholderiales bacterium]